MNLLLRLYRIIGFVIVYIFAILVSLPHRLRGAEGTKGVLMATSLWARGVSKLVGLKVKVHGKYSPQKNALIVSNHLSYIDILIHASLFTIRFTPKSEVAKWFFIGMVINSSRPIWVNRTSKASSAATSREFANTLKGGMNLIVYPEGTTSDGKHGVLPFKSTPFEASISTGIPVLPVLICYPSKNSENDICWHGDTRFRPHVWNMLGMREIIAEIYIMDPVFPGNMPRKEFSEHVHRLMSVKFDSINRKLGKQGELSPR